MAFLYNIKSTFEGSVFVKRRYGEAIYTLDNLPKGRITRDMMLDFYLKHNEQLKAVFDAHKQYALSVEQAGNLIERENEDLRKRIQVLETKLKGKK
jgi:hypothetical protein